jgi:predicted GIY-YIG superfamily endonuclease
MATLATAVYRFYDDADRLLYVGITSNLPTRFRDHQSGSSWWTEQRRATVVWMDSRAEAADEERAAICSEKPQCNIQGTRPRPSGRRRRLDPDTRQAIAAEVRAEISRAGRSKAYIRQLLGGLSVQSAWARYTGQMPYRDDELAILADDFGIPVARFMPASLVTA